MSLFVELPADAYPAGAFDGFVPGSVFSLENARSAMWMAQLAYESDPLKIAHIGAKWRFESIQPFPEARVRLARTEARGIVARRGDLVMLAFAGTDPVRWQDLAIDLDFPLTRAGNTHEGFERVASAASAQAQRVADECRRDGRALVIVGHSLGAGIGLLTALIVSGTTLPAAVYAFGCPRAGGADFRARYDGAGLGARTFRLVHGRDFVARLPPFASYKHVGRLLSCDSGTRFSGGSLTAVDSEEPAPDVRLGDFTGYLPAAVEDFLRPRGLNVFARFFGILPPPVRDHVPDSYLAALKS